MEQQLDLGLDMIEPIREGQYTLLLGAGGSIGATSQTGEPLPNGQVFAEEFS